MWISRARLAAVRRPVALWLSLVALATLPGCGLDGLKHMFDLPPTDCAAFTRGPFQVGRSGGDRTLTVGASVEESVTPGSSKPVHGSVADLPAGDYTLRVSAVGSGQETATYQVRLTPN